MLQMLQLNDLHIELYWFLKEEEYYKLQNNSYYTKKLFSFTVKIKNTDCCFCNGELKWSQSMQVLFEYVESLKYILLSEIVERQKTINIKKKFNLA